MKIDFIIYSENSAVGIVYRVEWLVPIIALKKEFRVINEKVIRTIKEKCHYVKEDSKLTEYLMNNYTVGDFIEKYDWEKIIPPLFQSYVKRLQKDNNIDSFIHDNNYAELAKDSNDEFVYIIIGGLFEKLKSDNQNEELKRQCFLVSEILCKRDIKLGQWYLVKCYLEGIGVQKSEDKALEYIKKTDEFKSGIIKLEELIDDN